MAETVSYRCITATGIHLPPPEEGSIAHNEVVQFDGKVLTLESGEVRKLLHPKGIQAAINAGWLVPVESDVTQYVPKPAGVKVHAAQATGEEREQVNVMTVADEERDLGSAASVRQEADQNSSKRVSQGAPTGVQDTDDGRVVGRFKTSAKGEPIEVGKDDQKIKNALDNKSKIEVERYGNPVRRATATGDVEEALVGDDLTELLPNAASSDRPEPGVFENDGVQVGSAGSSVGGQDDGVVISKVGASEALGFDRSSAALEGALRKWATTGETWNGKPVHLGEMKMMVESVLSSLDAARQKLRDPVGEPAEKPETPTDEVGAPSFADWDTTVHWKKRQAKALNEFGDDPSALRAILAVENSAGVKKAINERLRELG
jgi:hypothetical protein